MRTLTKELERRRINYGSLIEYGFVLMNDTYTYEKIILDNEFKIIVEVVNDVMTAKLIEVAVDEEYLMADIETATGEYVGKIKEEYDLVITDIISKCTVDDVFKSKQAKEIIKYVKEKYNDDLEFLWKKFDDNAIWRNKKNNKWYGALLIVKESKLGFKTDKLIEIIDLRYQKELIDDLIDNKKIFPGYHMNKKSWITVVLDGSVDIKEIYRLIDNSYELSLKK